MEDNHTAYQFFQRGIGLVEILVSITASLLLLAGLINVMLNNQRVYRIDRNLAELQTNGRYATMFINRAVRLAGFRTAPSFDDVIGYKDLTSLFPAGAQLIQATNNSTNGSDTLTVRYQGSLSGNIFDCQGQVVQPNQIAENTFFINSQSQLACNAINNGVANPNNPSILVDGVQAMHFRFGEDLNNDMMVNRYVPPSFASLNMNRVVSIRVSFLLRSLEPASPTANNDVFTLQDATLGPFGDKYIRRVITSTIKLRSMTGQ